MAYNTDMRFELKELLDKLGVGYIMSAYETCPWSAYDEEKGMTCSAEVRMNHDGDEIEAEMQVFHDTPEPGKPPVEQVFWLFARPVVAESKWEIRSVKVRGEEQANSVYAWEEKCCGFFDACVQELKMGNMPDIEEILKRELHENERYGGGRGGGGSKSPKIKPQALLGMKQGRGF